MTTWATVWAVVLGVSLTTFALLAVAVAVGGLRDVREMFRRIDRSHQRTRE